MSAQMMKGCIGGVLIVQSAWITPIPHDIDYIFGDFEDFPLSIAGGTYVILDHAAEPGISRIPAYSSDAEGFSFRHPAFLTIILQRPGAKACALLPAFITFSRQSLSINHRLPDT